MTLLVLEQLLLFLLRNLMLLLNMPLLSRATTGKILYEKDANQPVEIASHYETSYSLFGL